MAMAQAESEAMAKYRKGDKLTLEVEVITDHDLGHICMKAGDEQFALEARTLDKVVVVPEPPAPEPEPSGSPQPKRRKWLGV